MLLSIFVVSILLILTYSFSKHFRGKKLKVFSLLVLIPSLLIVVYHLNLDWLKLPLIILEIIGLAYFFRLTSIEKGFIVLIFFSACFFEAEPVILDDNDMPLVLGFTLVALISFLKTFRLSAMTDNLTKIYNRHVLDTPAFLNRFNKKSIIMLVVDIDKFKLINDKYGHKVGDSVIISTTKGIKQAIRKKDILVRIGGDEFMVLIKVTDSICVNSLIERLRASIKNQQEVENLPKFTVSIGEHQIDCFNTKTFLEGFQKADERMYLAKRVS